MTDPRYQYTGLRHLHGATWEIYEGTARRFRARHPLTGRTVYSDSWPGLVMVIGDEEWKEKMKQRLLADICGRPEMVT
jgi:hypothetical protein